MILRNDKLKQNKSKLFQSKPKFKYKHNLKFKYKHQTKQIKSTAKSLINMLFRNRNDI